MAGLLIDGEFMRKLAKQIRKQIPGVGFALLVYPFHEPGMANYISNSQREDMIKSLREVADRLEKGKEFPTPENN